MIPHRTKIRRHLRSTRVEALTPEERREELRAAEARCAEGHGPSEPAGADPAGATGGETPDSASTPHTF